MATFFNRNLLSKGTKAVTYGDLISRAEINLNDLFAGRPGDALRELAPTAFDSYLDTYIGQLLEEGKLGITKEGEYYEHE